MNVEELFQGIAVIFDDELNDSKSTISRIKAHIQEKNIPVAVYTEIPHPEIIPSLSNASFVILDWDYNNSFDVESSERVSIGNELTIDEQGELIKFIKNLLHSVFIPVFIFTSKSVDSIQKELKDASLWDDDKENRIFIKQKNDIKEAADLFKAIEDWIRTMPSVYVLKAWERSILKSKDAMFLELYRYSPSWVKIIWEMLEKDTIENHREFGEFVTRNLNNRIESYSFDPDFMGVDRNISPEELGKVVQGERFLFYDKNQLPQQAYTGDLFKIKDKYYLNIRAQCDLSRKDTDGNYNPILYCIEGKKLNQNEFVKENIRITKDGKLELGIMDTVDLKKIEEICANEEYFNTINKQFIKYQNSNSFRNGTFLERNDKVIVGCVADQKALRFNLDIKIKEFKDFNNKRIGRILPPYITRIQQKCAQNMIREGVMPIPGELFS